jgi:hypothetical protein
MVGRLSGALAMPVPVRLPVVPLAVAATRSIRSRTLRMTALEPMSAAAPSRRMAGR